MRLKQAWKPGFCLCMTLAVDGTSYKNTTYKKNCYTYSFFFLHIDKQNLYSRLAGVSPFKGTNDFEVLNKTKTCDWEFDEDFASFSEEAKDFICKLLQKNARYTKILQTNFLIVFIVNCCLSWSSVSQFLCTAIFFLQFQT